MNQLDDQAYINLRELQPGDVFTLRDQERVLIECSSVVHPIEQEPYVRGYELEGPRGSRSQRCFRAVRISRVGKILPKE